MKVKIAIIVSLLLVIAFLSVMLINPKILLREKSATPESKTSLAPKTESQQVLSYKSSDFGIEFSYLSDYQVSEAPGTEVYGSNETVVFTFQNKISSLTPTTKIIIYKYLENDTIEGLVEKIKADFPDLETRQCKSRQQITDCIYLISKGEKQLPIQYIVKSSFGIDASFIDMPKEDYHFDSDYTFFPEPAKSFLETSKRF